MLFYIFVAIIVAAHATEPSCESIQESYRKAETLYLRSATCIRNMKSDQRCQKGAFVSGFADNGEIICNTLSDIYPDIFPSAGLSE